MEMQAGQVNGLHGVPLKEASAPSFKITRLDRIQAAETALPDSYAEYTDKYFLRTYEILKAEGINPWVRAQVIIRKGPGTLGGIDEAIAVLTKYSPLLEHGGTIRALEDGESFEAGETLMVIEGPIQDIVALETMYLGVMSAETTKATDGIEHVDLDVVREKMEKITSLVDGRSIIYMGARHWRYQEDRAIAAAAFEGGAALTSTDIGGEVNGTSGVGTIPHVLENIMAYLYGKDRAVVESTKAFDRVIDPSVPRIALIDYNNREITDSLACARELGERLYAVRVDTCGENIAEGALTGPEDPRYSELLPEGLQIPEDEKKYWFGHGVTITGVLALRMALDREGFEGTKIVLSSGFADPAKVKAFVNAEALLGVKLFEMLGAGELFFSRGAKMDITGVSDGPEIEFTPISKAGRVHKENPRMKTIY